MTLRPGSLGEGHPENRSEGLAQQEADNVQHRHPRPALGDCLGRPVVDSLGFPPHHPYSELVWTSTLGPSAVLGWRRLAGMLLQEPEGFRLDIGEFAQALGLGASATTPQ